MKTLSICENGIHLVLGILEDSSLKLLHLSALPYHETDIHAVSLEEGFQLFEVNLSGYDRPYERHGNQNIVTAPGYRMKYVDMQDTRNTQGRKLEIVSHDEETSIQVTTHVQFYDGIRVLRMWNVVTNHGNQEQVLDLVSSFHYTGLEKEGSQPRDQKIRLRLAHNSWQRELNWKEYTLPQLGLELVQPAYKQHSSNMIQVSNVGHWSTKEYLPMAYIENQETGSSLFWQIEHNGSWHWEIGEQNGHLYVDACGPSEVYGHWSKILKPGDSFIGVPAAVGVSDGGFDASMGELTKYRRAIRRPNTDNEKLGIIFNDYMNCLWGDPTTEKELPLIDAAAEIGCEYYVIDCGWYSAGGWWSNVGEWLESRERFPGGLSEVTEYIRSKGMIPGVWLELEVMGIRCPKVSRVSEDWFFQRHGRKVYDRSRYQLDFRNPQVIQHADEVIDRLVQDYKVGYIKMDYNIEPGIGTDLNADSAGDGLLEHERAYLAWLDRVFERYPELIIENCSSGGLRMDYAMLSRYSIQSTSDQEDYRFYATIAANAPAGLTPEQAAVWSYPLREGDREEVVFNMVNAMLLRIHQSGHLAELSPERLALVKEGLDCYRRIRDDLKEALPIWPIGLSNYSDEWSSMGLRRDRTIYLAVWRREGGQHTVRLPLAVGEASVEMIYPSYEEGCRYLYDPAAGELEVTLDMDYMARLFRIQIEDC